MKLIERSRYLNRLKDAMGTPDIKVITGVRRCGKSKLMESFMNVVRKSDPKANIVHVNFNLSANECLTEFYAGSRERHNSKLSQQTGICLCIVNRRNINFHALQL